MPTQLYNTILYSGIAGLATIIGILLVLSAKEFTKKYSIYIVSFAAGVLITFALKNLIPQSLELYSNALIIVLIGFLLFYLIEHFVMLHPFHEPYEREHAAGKMAVLGLGVHSLIDGIVIGAGFEISQQIGIVATLAVISHELPEGITAMSVLLHSKVKRSLALFYSILVAIATPIGAILTYAFVRNINEGILGILIALAAGSFIYVGASDLVPESHEHYNRINALFMILGIVFVILISAIFS
ncbi:MAG: ZIP family metal transporter [Nanoarchaeota archaeon]